MMGAVPRAKPSGIFGPAAYDGLALSHFHRTKIYISIATIGPSIGANRLLAEIVSDVWVACAVDYHGWNFCTSAASCDSHNFNIS
jgi:hypothetical protein